MAWLRNNSLKKINRGSPPLLTVCLIQLEWRCKLGVILLCNYYVTATGGISKSPPSASLNQLIPLTSFRIANSRQLNAFVVCVCVAVTCECS